MRAGLYSMQQALTQEAASMVKQAVSLARRRGHAHVTPLHLASAMLASSNGHLRRACLQSHSHPLQFKALELCFNVALNRLPTLTSGPLFGHQSSNPSVSNALVAALKRAQAHQRRGTNENQQQTILALKVELEQLIISILDDPSVSRVMREAGFSSPMIKKKVEQAISLDMCSQNPTPIRTIPSKESSKPIFLGSNESQSLPFSRFGPTISKTVEKVRDEDVKSVLDSMLKKMRNTVIVGECLASSEAVVKSVLEKLEKGDDIPVSLRYVQFVNLPLSSLRNLYKDDVEQKILELGCLVKNYAARGVVLYLGDLKWVSDFWSNFGEQRRSYYCPVEHIIMEIKRLVCGVHASEKLWLIGTATFQSYMKCKSGYPSLESLWDLHPLTIPVGSLSLSLSLDSDLENQCESKISKDGECRPLLGSNFHCIESSVQNKDIITTKSTTVTSTSSSLPLWLQQYKDENIRSTTKDQEYTNVSDLCKRWDSFSSSINNNPPHPNKIFDFSASPSPCSSNTCSGGIKDVYKTSFSWSPLFETKEPPKTHQFWMSETKPVLLSNPNSSPNSASSSEVDEDMEGDMFKEFSAENLKILCNALESKVPWKRDVIPDIVSTVLKCRSGMSMPKQRGSYKEETWLFFLGNDNEGKDKIARELAKVIFGSQNNFTSISSTNFALSTRADSTEEHKNKKSKHETGCYYIERFGEAVNENPHRVFFMHDIEQADYYSQKGIKNAVQSGEITLHDGLKVPLKDAIIIFSCESLCSIYRACSPPNEEIGEKDSSSVSLDLNIGIDDNHASEHSVGEIGILDYVDRQIIFKVQEF